MINNKGILVGSIIICVLFVIVAVAGGKWATKAGQKNQANFDTAFSVLEK